MTHFERLNLILTVLFTSSAPAIALYGPCHWMGPLCDMILFWAGNGEVVPPRRMLVYRLPLLLRQIQWNWRPSFHVPRGDD